MSDVQDKNDEVNPLLAMDSNDLYMERALAIENMPYLFGRNFKAYHRVLRVSAFHKQWPINHIIQDKGLVIKNLYQG